MNILQINFYEEQLNILIASNFIEFKQIISQKFLLDPEDVDELIIYYLDRSNDKVSIANENDYLKVLEFQSKETKFNHKFLLNIFVEISEKSKLFQKYIFHRISPLLYCLKSFHVSKSSE